MKNGNICKFIGGSVAGRLETQNFVLETDPASLSFERPLGYHLAAVIVSGKGEFLFGDDRFSVDTGTFIFGFKGERMAVTDGGKLQYIYIGFDGARADELFKRFCISRVCRCFRGFEGIIPFWQSCIALSADNSADLVSESALLYAFSRLDGLITPSEDAVSKVISIIDEDFSDRELSLASVSKRLGYNSKYLSHAFKEKVGVGFSAYLRNIRIKHAVFLMEHGVESVKNISYLCGFSDPLYFSSVFKQTVGRSPSEWWKERRNGE